MRKKQRRRRGNVACIPMELSWDGGVGDRRFVGWGSIGRDAGDWKSDSAVVEEGPGRVRSNLETTSERRRKAANVERMWSERARERSNEGVKKIPRGCNNLGRRE